jgi:hypothetical protein
VNHAETAQGYVSSFRWDERKSTKQLEDTGKERPEAVLEDTKRAREPDPALRLVLDALTPMLSRVQWSLIGIFWALVVIAAILLIRGR